MADVNWFFYPRSHEPPEIIRGVVNVFQWQEKELQSASRELTSDGILAIVRPGLEKIGFQVEKGKKAMDKVHVPVLFGRNGSLEKYFEADAWNRKEKAVVEVEAGRGYLNNQFLKDLFQACMMHDVEYCAIAVRNLYVSSKDYEKVVSFFETLYPSRRLTLPLKGVLVIGYGHST